MINSWPVCSPVWQGLPGDCASAWTVGNIRIFCSVPGGLGLLRMPPGVYGNGRSRREFAFHGSVPAFPAIRGGKLLVMGWHPKKPQVPWQVTKYVDVTHCPCTGAIPRQALPHWGTYWPAIYHKRYIFMDSLEVLFPGGMLSVCG